MLVANARRYIGGSVVHIIISSDVRASSQVVCYSSQFCPATVETIPILSRIRRNRAPGWALAHKLAKMPPSKSIFHLIICVSACTRVCSCTYGLPQQEDSLPELIVRRSAPRGAGPVSHVERRTPGELAESAKSEPLEPRCVGTAQLTSETCAASKPVPEGNVWHQQLASAALGSC